jgi:glucose/arabinose dehydrogenase/ketosteroid isomerase-like protein
MNRWTIAGIVALAVVAGGVLAAQGTRPAPRPPARTGPPTPEEGSAAPDGYSPIPEWLGQTRAPRPATTAAFDVETYADGLSGVFSMAFLPDGRILVGERPGRIRIVAKDGKVSPPLAGMPANLWAKGQGLFDAVPDRAFATNRVLYLGYTVLPDGVNADAPLRSPGVLLVASAKLSADDKRIENVKVLLDAEGTGGRVVQAPDGTLLVTSTIPAGVGIKSADWPQPQQFDSNMGKVLRINTDGSIPRDNPFAGRAGARPEIFALGFRDVQGATIHPRTGKLWLSEHGPRGGDEINLVEKGKNYGFPVIGYGRDYTGKPINDDKTAQDGMEQPVYFWTPDIAPAGIGFYTGRLFPAWQGNLFVSALAGKALLRLVLKDDRVVAEQRLLTELDARIRAVGEGPDGALYVMTDGNEAKILRLVPKKSGSQGGGVEPAAGAADRELKDLVQRYNDAQVKRDRGTLEQIWADDYLYTHSNGAVMNKAQDIADTMSGDMTWTAAKLDDLNVRVYGEVGIVTGRLTMEGRAKQYASGARRFTDIFVRRGGRWQLVGGQTTLPPK